MDKLRLTSVYLLVFQQIEIDEYMDWKVQQPVVRFYGVTTVRSN